MKESEENIAEVVGIILGDGHLHKKCNKITIVGSLEERREALNLNIETKSCIQ